MSSAGNTSSIDSGFFPMTSQERPENDYTIQDLSFSSAATWRHASSSTTGIRNDLVINSNFFWLNTPAATTTSTGSTTPPQAAEEDAHKTQQTPVTVVPPGSSVMYTPESPEDPFPLPSNQHDIHVERMKPRQRTSKIEPYPTRKSLEAAPATSSTSPQSAPQEQPPVTKAVPKAQRSEEIAVKFPTFGVPVSPNGNKILDEVDGRLPTVGDRSKYILTVDELRRRTNAPEYMNLSTIYGFFRKSKKKECIVELKKTLCENNIEIPRMQRQRQLNCFSPILEEEAVQLAYDIEMLYKKYFPVADVGRQMLENLLKKGHTVEICEKMLTNTLAVMNQIIETLNSRQPKINGKDEKLKGTPLDVAYHVFSNSTHGFGHPNSLTHYRTYRDIVSHAILLSRKMLKGEPLLPIEKPDPNEKPFALMSDNEFMAMINGRVEKKPDINNIVN